MPAATGTIWISCRYGNIYTARQLLQLAEEAFLLRPASSEVWEKGGRYFDALRPSVDPAGHSSPNIIRELRRAHLGAVRSMFFNPDMRNINDRGVEFVMSHFFACATPGLDASPATVEDDLNQPICDEGKLEEFAPPTKASKVA